MTLTILTMMTTSSRAPFIIAILCLILTFGASETSLGSNNGAGIVNEIVEPPEHTVEEHYHSPLPHTYLSESDLPTSFTWQNVDGKSYLTRTLNQHVPQYCGSCWAHGTMSSLADRIKIARKAQGDDINLSIQYILNCGKDMAGSCHGGSMTGVYQLIQKTSFAPYDTCMPYLACSSDSAWGFCPHVDTTCTAFNTCRTCSMHIIPWMKTECNEIDVFPNATVAEYGVIKHNKNSVHQIKAEIYARGPVAASINGKPLHTYHGGIYANTTESKNVTHVVAIVGWGHEEKDENDDSSHDYHGDYWILRNSWGEYWGQMGFFRIAAGQNVLGIEHKISWATPGTFSESNFPCSESGANCGPEHSSSNSSFAMKTTRYIDPSVSFLNNRVKRSPGGMRMEE